VAYTKLHFPRFSIRWTGSPPLLK